jgi:putative transcriptional regulator|tara:strand:+ start:15885 stop:16457 length:573 start_codon:yes stop_codon:yes gene_type:complete
MEMDYFNYKSNNKVKKGSILLSEPFMKDINFIRSVILICEHNDEGSFGYKLNSIYKKPNINIIDNELIKNLHYGGPVENEYLNFIHNCNYDYINSNKISDNLFFGGDINLFKKIIKENKSIKYKFFLGYSGWTPTQLNDEINSNSWIVINNYDEKYLFNSGNNQYWSNFLRNIGGKNKIFSNYPLDPSLN